MLLLRFYKSGNSGNSAFLVVIGKVAGEYIVSEKKNNTNTIVKTTIILVVDDNPIVRDGVAQLINLEADMVVSAKAGNITEAIKAIKAVM